ncbi:MAG: hypothetical protein WDA41_07695 [Candidatus Neomarinimicrobiota bacterium]|nr:hypothetical protein [Candidatus Neomarinimicrobiota bacterium]
MHLLACLSAASHAEALIVRDEGWMLEERRSMLTLSAPKRSEPRLD